jgi:hypothetical protein
MVILDEHTVENMDFIRINHQVFMVMLDDFMGLIGDFCFLQQKHMAHASAGLDSLPNNYNLLTKL